MRGRTGVIAAVLVLAGGVGLAFVFHKPKPAAKAERSEPSRRQADEGPRFLMEVRSERFEAPPWEDAPAAIGAPPDPIDVLTSLPLFETASDSLPRIARSYPMDASAEAGNPLRTRGNASASWVQHRVQDGDTLAALAERYLHDAARQDEIFQANRDVLSSPDLLPIGAMLKIPPQ